MLKFVLKCISKINIFAGILLKPTYLLNYGVKKTIFTLISDYILY